MEAQIRANQIKYGLTFDSILRLIHQANIYHLNLRSESQNHPSYVNLCEGFFQVIYKEITYHNYIMMMSHHDYQKVIIDCFNKAIYLKDRYHYKVTIDDVNNLCEQIQVPMINYLSNLTRKIRTVILTSSSASGLDQLTPTVNLKTIKNQELESHFNRSRGCFSLKKFKHKRPLILPNKCYPTAFSVPVAKMELNYAKVPIIRHGKPYFQKNILDL